MDSAARSAFIERLGIYYESYGVPRIGGRMLGLLLSAEEPVDAESIALDLGVSRASVSTNLRLLVGMGLAAKAPSPGSRRDRYDVAPDAWERAIVQRIEGFSRLATIVTDCSAAVDEPAGGAATIPMAPTAVDAKLGAMLAWIALEKSSQEMALVDWKASMPPIAGKHGRP